MQFAFLFFCCLVFYLFSLAGSLFKGGYRIPTPNLYTYLLRFIFEQFFEIP